MHKTPDLSIDDKDTRYIRNIRNETTVLAAVVIISSFLVDIFFETSIGQKSPKGWHGGKVVEDLNLMVLQFF